MPTGKEAGKRKDGKSSFDALIEYIEDPDKVQDQTREQPDVWAINCLSIDTAAVEMTSTAMQNSQSEGNAAYHAIISWSGETPSAAQAKEAGLIALKELGFDIELGGHQCFLAYHHDSQNPHVHIAANKIHPQTLKSLHIEWSHKTLHQACRLIEIKQGWSHQKGIKEVVTDVDGNEQIIDSDYRNSRNSGVSQKALDVEKHSGNSSFERYIKQVVGHLLKEELKSKNTCWKSVHALLSNNNVKLVSRGGGFAFSDMPLFLKSFTQEQREAEVLRASKTHASASTAGSFAKAAFLIKKLGEFEPSFAERTLPEIRYNAKSTEGVELISIKSKSEPTQTTGIKLQAVSNDQILTEIDTDTIRLKAIFDKAMSERKALFQAKIEARKLELTDIKKSEEKQLQETLNDSRKRAHAANAAMPPELKLMTSDVNDILRIERDKKKAELKQIQKNREQKFDQEFDAQQAKLHKHNSFHRWLAEQSEAENELSEIAKRIYNQSKMREQIIKEKTLDIGGQTIACPASKRSQVVILSVSKTMEQQGYKAYKNSDHIAYTKQNKVRFKDFGNVINIVADDDEQVIRHALLLAQEKYGNVIKINGSATFQEKAARIAYEIGIQEIQSDDNPQALEIFKSLKENRIEVDLAKLQADSINIGKTPKAPFMDFSDRDEWKKLDSQADLLKISLSYGYIITKQSGDAIRLTKDDQVLNINTGSSSDTFFMLNDQGRTISGTAQDFIRHEEKLSYSDAAQKLFILNRKFSKELETSGQAVKEKNYDIAYVRHLFNEATNDANNMQTLNTNGLYKNDISADTRVSDKGEVFFAHRDANNNIVGFEIKTAMDRPVWFVKGGAKCVFKANTIDDKNIERVVIVMDAIEAEAIKKLELKQNPLLIDTTLYLSVGGSASQKQIDYLSKFKHAEIELHVSKDTTGFDKVIEKLETSLNIKTIRDVNPTLLTEKQSQARKQSNNRHGIY